MLLQEMVNSSILGLEVRMPSGTASWRNVPQSAMSWICILHS